MSAVRRLIHVRPDKANRPAPMDETEKAEAEKAAEKAAKELFDLLEVSCTFALLKNKFKCSSLLLHVMVPYEHI